MGVFVGLILIAAGAVLIWGVTGEVSGIDVDAIGVILIVVGLIGFLLDLMFWSSWGHGFGRRRVATSSEPAYVERRYVEPRTVRRVTEVEEAESPGPPAPPPVP